MNLAQGTDGRKKSLPSCDFDISKVSVKLNLRIPAQISAISPLVDGVMKIAGGMECARGKEMEIETALREALANAIVHGAENDPSKSVQVCVACDEDHGMLIVVRNPGNGFDPTKIADPTVGENLFENHGRGIYLINQLMDKVEFKNGGTEIHMRKY